MVVVGPRAQGTQQEDRIVRCEYVCVLEEQRGGVKGERKEGRKVGRGGKREGRNEYRNECLWDRMGVQRVRGRK